MNGLGHEIGDRVRNTTTGTAVPVGGLGTVMDGPMTTYGVTVLWDGVELSEGYGERGWRPYWPTTELEHVDERKHAVYDPCPKCGKQWNNRVFTGIPGRVMGGCWIAGAEIIECSCGKRLLYRASV
jgi:hypothetical protein